MNKFLIPGILAATVLVAGFVAVMPVQKVQTIHSTILAAITADIAAQSAALGNTAGNSATNLGADHADLDADIAALPGTLGNTGGPSGATLGADHLAIDRALTWTVNDFAATCAGGCIIATTTTAYAGIITVTDRLSVVAGGAGGDAAGAGCSVSVLSAASGPFASPTVGGVFVSTAADTISVTTAGPTVCDITIHLSSG